ncbi:MAG: hypothetical protein A2W18_06240 [Candidatus Muproteobacteria bacterium RBG_16_60_9]|uniref:DUF3261 domain-containing protein n=1 Tax=Candidatus Muproteobacteria bacterium RBG_16_60_9 TaxID=1817755 RepID=A0A1F6UWE8_9PROT|nr:MAG: hypothetical protein A2W18_06240 [Candidatus Muproteobacteria bacterium RBG_16_60_9]
MIFMSRPWMSSVRFALGILIVAALGCAHVETERDCAKFGASRFCLQPSATRFTVTQSVVVMYRGGGQRLVVYVEVGENDLSVVGVTPFGRRMFLLRYGPSGLDASSQMSGDVGLSAEQLLAGLQLAFWPLASARAGVRGVATRLDESPDGVTRRLWQGGTEIFTASCEGRRPVCRRARLSYPTLGQTLSIETVEGAPS